MVEVTFMFEEVTKTSVVPGIPEAGVTIAEAPACVGVATTVGTAVVPGANSTS